MEKYQVIVADCPWSFSDKLSMSDVKRGAESNYNTLSLKQLCELPVNKIADDSALLALWCPSSLLPDGIKVMESWGFSLKQTHIWVKIKKVKELSINNLLAFGMGRLFRQTHEIVLVGTKGKIYDILENRSQRSVHFAPVEKHSKKPEALQDMLDLMFPSAKKIELFARRERSGWTCLGNECPSSFGEDVYVSLRNLYEVP